jgi:hypothetical protein
MSPFTAWREYAAWQEWLAREAHYEAINCCTHCGGFGDHGLDEDGCLYVCYGCGGTGKYFQEVA